MRPWKIVLLCVVVIAVVCGAIVYLRPLEVMRTSTRIRLRLEGAQRRSVMAGEYRAEYYELAPRRQDAPVVLLIHGLGGSALDWVPVMPAMAKAGFHVYAPNLLGYGNSSHPNIDYAIAKQADFVNDFVHAAGVCTPPRAPEAPCTADVVGWSMGGWIAMRYTLGHPQQVSRLVLDDAAGVDYEPSFAPSLFTPSTPDEGAALVHLLEPGVPRFPGWIMRDYLRAVGEKRDTVARSITTFETRTEVMDKELPGITAPTLVNWGADDLLIPLAVGRKTASLIPGSNLNIFEGCGHLAPSRCADRVTPATIAFLQANPAPRSQVATIAAPVHAKNASAAATRSR